MNATPDSERPTFPAILAYLAVLFLATHLPSGLGQEVWGLLQASFSLLDSLLAATQHLLLMPFGL